MSKVFITDYITYPNIEKKILGTFLSPKCTSLIEVLLVWKKIIDKTVIDNLPKLKAIIRYGVGCDNIDLVYATDKKIFVCNVPDYGVDEVSDTAIGMVLTMARGIMRYNQIMLDSLYDNWDARFIKNIKRNSNMTLGVVGAGRIGSQVILKANFMKFNTIFYDPYKEIGYEKVLFTKRTESLNELVTLSDIISFHIPLTNETRGMINSEVMKNVKVGASIINTSRGKIFSDLEIIYDALKSNRISSIAFDVLPEEPPIENKLFRAFLNREKWIDGRVIINPHVAFYSKQSFNEMRRKAALNALRVLNNQEPLYIVNNVLGKSEKIPSM